MTISGNEIVQFVGDLCEEEGIKVGVKESIKGGFITGTTAAIAGLLLGPIGLAAGGTVGGLVSYWMGKGKFESVPSVLNNMDKSKKTILITRIRDLLQSNGITKVGQISTLMKSVFLKEIILQVVISVLVSVLGYAVNAVLAKYMSKRSQTDKDENPVHVINEDGTMAIENISNQL